MNETIFRERCRRACAAHPTLPHLRTIAAVGAYDAEIGGRGRDSDRLTDALDYLLRSGFLIDPDFEIDIVNFREGRDFLFEDKQADLVFVSNIMSGRPSCLPVFWKAQAGQLSEDQLIITVSRRNEPAFWAHRIEEAKTKFVVTFGGEIEVNAQTFCDDYGLDFAVLIPSPEDECCSRFTAAAAIKPLYPTLPDIDLPQGWFGFAADKGFLAASAPALASSTCLGRQALTHIVASAPQNDPSLPRTHTFG
ncbi:MAG: hypothetical protein WC043_07295 [Pseudobdellovibrionaceae bacterium]